MKKAFLILSVFFVLPLGFYAAAQSSNTFLTTLSQPMNTVDADEDGLDDAIEEQLIDRFRPYYFFDHANDKWAASVLWYVSRSELYYQSSPTTARILVYSREQLAANPRLVLQASVSGVSSNSAINPQSSGYFIDPRSSEDANGEGPCADVGCYAHVMPITLPIQRNNYPEVDDDSNPHPAILIQFYQFFPYNDSQSSLGGDHEGDWIYMDIYVKPEAPYHLIGVVYHHHGDGTCPPTPVKSLSRPPANLPLTCGIPDNSVAPVCFLEEDNHEWWPWAGDNECEYGAGIYNDRHDGNGVRYRVRNVINLGERFAPSDNLEAQVALLFNGKWGSDVDGDFFEGQAPKAITDGDEHFFPVPKLVVAYVQPRGPIRQGLGVGSRYHPLRTINQAVDSLGARGIIRLRAGSYSKPRVLGGPGVNLQIEAIGGTAVIGQ